MMGLVTPAGVAAGTFWDSRFGLPCYPGVAADGVTRCLPPALDLSAPGRYRSRPDCTGETLTAVPALTCELGFVSDSAAPETSCPARQHRYPLAPAPHVGPAYMGAPGSCIAADVTPGYALHAVLDELPPSELVEVTEPAP
jgi:hypothetical protein